MDFSKEALLTQVVLKEEKAAVEVDAYKCNKFEVEQFGFKVKQEWATLEDVSEDVTKTILNQLVGVLN